MEITRSGKKAKIAEEITQDYDTYYRGYINRADYGRVSGNIRDPILNKEGFSNAELAFLDPQVSACFLITVFAVLNKKGSFKPPKDLEKKRDYKRAEEISRFLNFTLKKLKGSEKQTRFDLLTSKFFGCSFVERVYDVLKDGKYQNYYYYSRMKSRRTGLWDFSYDKFGNINGYISLLDPTKKVFPLNKFMSMSWLPLWNNPNGTPDFAKVRRFFKAKKEYIIFLLSLGARQSKGKQTILQGDSDLTDGNDTEHQNLLKKLNDYLSVYVPKGYDVNFAMFNTKALEDFLKVLRYLDSQIAIAMLSNSLTTNQNEKTGSYAMAKAQIETGTFSFTDYACNVLSDIYDEQYARDLIELNYDPIKYPPEIWPVYVLEDPEYIDPKKQSELLKDLKELTLFDPDTETDALYGRNLFDLPENKELFDEFIEGRREDPEIDSDNEPPDDDDTYQELEQGTGDDGEEAEPEA